MGMTATLTSSAQWQNSLVEQGATLENGAIVQFGDAKSELASTANSNVLCDLNHLGLLEISGADAVTFLQGQVTNDVKSHIKHCCLLSCSIYPVNSL